MTLPTATPPNGRAHESAVVVALHAQGMDGAGLLLLAQKVANEELRRKASTLGDRYDDLVSYLVLVGLRSALTYDETRSGNGYSFASYLWDVMSMRTADFYRRHSEGFGDRRAGTHDRIVLGGVDDEEVPFEFEWDLRLSDRRVQRWQRAADVEGFDLSDWIAMALNDRASRVTRAA